MTKDNSAPTQAELIKQLQNQIADLQRQVRELREASRPSAEVTSVTRRNLLLGAGAAVAGLATALVTPSGSPTLAADGSNLVIGQDNQNTSNVTSLTATSLSGPAFRVSNYVAPPYDNYSDAFQAYTDGAGFAAVYGRNDTGGGAGVMGYSAGGTGLYASGPSGPNNTPGNGGRIQQDSIGPSGPPAFTPNNFEQVRDSNGILWLSGPGGSWYPAQPGGNNNALFTAVSTQQYTLTGSDGSTWYDMDDTNLACTLVPSYNCVAILMGNADLFTSTAGYNQDIGIFVSGGTYGTGEIVAWKESGGFAGTFSPNAAFVNAAVPLTAGISYTVKLQWKSNRSNPGTIWAGAGPIGGAYSPTRLTAVLIAT